MPSPDYANAIIIGGAEDMVAEALSGLTRVLSPAKMRSAVNGDIAPEDFSPDRNEYYEFSDIDVTPAQLADRLHDRYGAEFSADTVASWRTLHDAAISLHELANTLDADELEIGYGQIASCRIRPHDDEDDSHDELLDNHDSKPIQNSEHTKTGPDLHSDKTFLASPQITLHRVVTSSALPSVKPFIGLSPSAAGVCGIIRLDFDPKDKTSGEVVEFNHWLKNVKAELAAAPQKLRKSWLSGREKSFSFVYDKEMTEVPGRHEIYFTADSERTVTDILKHVPTLIGERSLFQRVESGNSRTVSLTSAVRAR